MADTEIGHYDGTFYLVAPTMLASGLVARLMREDGALPVRVMLRDAAKRVRR